MINTRCYKCYVTRRIDSSWRPDVEELSKLNVFAITCAFDGEVADPLYCA